MQHRVDRGPPRPEGVADPLHDLRRLLVKTVPQPAQIFFRVTGYIFQYTIHNLQDSINPLQPGSSDQLLDEGPVREKLLDTDLGNGLWIT